MLDVVTLKKFMSGESEILGRSATGLCSKCQRKVAKAIKKARNIGVIPHIGDYIIQDTRPTKRKSNYHDSVVGKYYVSKTVL